jgi:hypothetical protein
MSLSLREIETPLRVLNDEKYGLVYAYLKAQGNDRWTPYDYADAEKAVAGRRREIMNEERALRTERKALKLAARTLRESKAAENRERKQASRDAVTDECQICEHRQCLTATGTMVHHGYFRPGYGHIEGDCFGVGRLPFPATDALVEYLEVVRSQAASHQQLR